MVDIRNKNNEELSIKAQLQIVKEAYPKVWQYILDAEKRGHDRAMTATLLQYDDNDEVIKEEDQMKVFLNPGHSPDGRPDPGACNYAMDLRECDIAKTITDLVAGYLTAAGVQVMGNVQSDDLVGDVVGAANASGADVFISIHCNSFANPNANGTETCVYPGSSVGVKLGGYIQRQIVEALDTTDRGIKYRDGLYVLRATNMPAVLVETAFISNGEDAAKLRDQADEFARAIARGVTDYVCSL